MWLVHRKTTWKGKQLTCTILDCEKNLENMGRAYSDTGRTCKLHTKRPLAWNETQRSHSSKTPQGQSRKQKVLGLDLGPLGVRIKPKSPCQKCNLKVTGPEPTFKSRRPGIKPMSSLPCVCVFTTNRCVTMSPPVDTYYGQSAPPVPSHMLDVRWDLV